MEKVCVKCGELREHQAKGMCYPCYRKIWKPHKIICKHCGKEREHHAFGLCGNCHMKLHHYDIVKSHNVRKYHNISLEQYRKLSSRCIVCDFDKVLDLHHLDGNRMNNSEDNLIPLCPNHHKMIHHPIHAEEVKSLIKQKLATKN